MRDTPSVPQSHVASTGLDLRTQAGLQVLYLHGLFPAGQTGGARDLGQRLLVGRRQVDHDEHTVRHVRAGAGAAFAVAGERGEELIAALGVLEVQGDDLGQAELWRGAPPVGQEYQEAQHEEGGDGEDHVEEQL